MYWEKIIDELEKYGDVETWNSAWLCLENRDDICGVKLYINGVDQLSIISHMHSYGGTNNLFEITPGIEYEIEGFLTEEEVIEKIKNIMKK